MFKTLALLFNTVIYLKPIQIQYHLWYKLKWIFGFYKKVKYSKFISVKRLHFESYQLIKSDNKYLGNNVFIFLNLQHDFGSTIDWHFQKNGRLWQYNLQYFDFIHDSKFELDNFQLMIEDFSQQILLNKIKLEPYLVSIRLVNWLLFYSKTGYKSKSFDEAIFQQVQFLKNNLEFHLLANHLFENYISLYISSLYLEDKPLQQFSIENLNKEISEQIHADGAHYEGSVMYHIIILSRLLIVHQLHVQNAISSAFQKQIEVTVCKMYAWMNLMRFRNNSYPFFNDATFDITISLATLDNYFHHYHLPKMQIKLGESGYKKLENEHFEVIVDCANISPSYQPGHAHADMQHFCFHFKNKPILIDPGVSTYEVGTQRLLERSSYFHNTVVINDESQSEIWSSFRMARRAKIKIIKESDDTVISIHDGYKKLFGVECERSFNLNANELNIIDTLIGNSTVRAKAYFYFAPEVTIIDSNHETLMINQSLSLKFIGISYWTIESIKIPNGYNQFKETKRIVVTFQKKLQTIFTESIS